MAEDWSRQEVDLIVADYFQMLALDISGKPYNKADHNRNLLPLLNNRSRSSIEFKHQNISAVLAKLGQPYIPGYKPAWNYQGLLAKAVTDYLRENRNIETSFKHFALADPILSNPIDFETFEEERPLFQSQVQEPSMEYRSPLRVNYLEMEQANTATGALGEELVVKYEKWRLIKIGKDSWVDKIERVSETRGPVAGYDILSRNENGTDRFIEVKATKLTKESPFYFTKNEYDFSSRNKSSYYLYRVFNLTAVPKLFIVNGVYDDFCHYEPIKYKGIF
jgi:hypothetical protein